MTDSTDDVDWGEPPADWCENDMTTPRAEWRIKSLRPEFTISATQVESWRSCKRKWWFERVRLRDVQARSSPSMILGTVLHAVIERYLRADDLGRDENGNEVDLYPEGWHIARGRFGQPSEGQIDLGQREVVKRLISAAIEQGILVRRAGRSVEAQFRLPVCDGVSLMGFVDVAFPDEIEDHKTTKSMRYAKSAAQLRVNPSMLIYAHAVLHGMRERGEQEPQEMRLRHNVYCVDPDDMRVKSTATTVSLEEIQAAWHSIVRDAEEMARVRRDTELWHEIPDPPDMPSPCNAYGGCPYLPVCNGTMSPDALEKRLDSPPAKTYSLSWSPPKATVLTINGNSMPPTSPTPAWADRIAAKRGAAASAAPVLAAAGTPAPPPPAQTVASGLSVASAAAVANSTPPPWADPSCLACGGAGFDSRGTPCRICDHKSSKAGRTTSAMYVVEALGDGTYIWEPRAGAAGAAPPAAAVVDATAGQVAAAFKGTSPAPTATKAVKTKVVEQAPPPAAAAPEQEEEEQEGDDGSPSTKGKPGRPRLGWTLLVDCTPLVAAGGRKIIVLHRFLQELFESISATNHFERKEVIASMGKEIAESFPPGSSVVCVGAIGGTDLRSALDAIRPYAATEIVGVSPR